VEEGSESYRKLLFREGRLAGFIFIGEVAGAGSFLALMKKKEIVSPQDLISKSFFRRKCLPQGLGFRHGSLFSGQLG
jgi:NAD(P)H-nitrite reductase large subunit